eukprot:1519736-Rhodomonas_salina.1
MNLAFGIRTLEIRPARSAAAIGRAATTAPFLRSSLSRRAPASVVAHEVRVHLLHLSKSEEHSSSVWLDRFAFARHRLGCTTI